MTRQTEDFWQFSLRVYASDDVAPSCLRLQDEHGLDVNLLLFCCWCGAQGLAMTPEQLAAARHLSGEWKSGLVQPLRNARRWLKDWLQEAAGAGPEGIQAQTQALRESIKAAELEAERLQQLQLAALSGGWDWGKQQTTAENREDQITANLDACVAAAREQVPAGLLEPLIRASIAGGPVPAPHQA